MLTKSVTYSRIFPSMARRKVRWSSTFREFGFCDVEFLNSQPNFRPQVSLFTSFATNGNPNGNVINAEMQGVEWKPVGSRNQPFKCLNVDENLKMENFPGWERLDVWDEIFVETNTPLY